MIRQLSSININQMEGADMLSQTKQDKIIRKVGIIVSKLMDLRELGADSATIQHIIDSVNEVESETLNS